MIDRELLDNITPSNFIEEAVLEDLRAGKNIEVITRCPPEPSGYWHIGHCKAWTIDFEVARKFGGYTNLRMDDTNPTKEDGDFAKSYIDDLKWLGYTPKNVIYSSEAYFDKFYELATNLIREGKAYVCELSADEVYNTRGDLKTAGTNSPYRDRPIEESLRLFEEMRNGQHPDGSMTLRLKIDMASPNMNMRDPIIYRIMHISHYKTGDKWCIYPMYDFAHPIEDALEGITYSLCDTSFEDHRPLYNWIVENCFPNLRYPPRQIEFAAMSIENILTGKRYLKQMVNSGKVMGWDDPRMYTIAGMRRRGIPATAVKNFVMNNGITKAVTILPISNLNYYIREELNRTATRAMVVLDPLKVVITNYTSEPETIEVENNPNEEPKTTHSSKFGRVVYIEKEDFSLDPPAKYNRLVLGGMVRLKNAYVIKCNNVVTKADGSIDYLECEYLPETRSGADNSGIKVKGTIHFVEEGNIARITVREIGNLTKMEYIEPAKALANGATIDDVFDPNSLYESEAFAEKFIETAKVGDVFQFVRKGYYCLDPDSTREHLVFNKTIGLKDTFNK